MSTVQPSTVLLGLGNPGTKYRTTRHNFGFLLLDRLSELWGDRGENLTVETSSPAARRQRWSFVDGPEERRCDLVWPSTYMNLSGRALEALYRLPSEEPTEELFAARLLVIIDDLSLPLGQIRWRERGSPGGHNGLRSVEATLRTDLYPRLRLGIGRPGPDSDIVDYVLSSFSEEEYPLVEAVLEEAAQALDSYLREGTSRVATVSRLNGWRPADLISDRGLPNA